MTREVVTDAVVAAVDQFEVHNLEGRDSQNAGDEQRRPGTPLPRPNRKPCRPKSDRGLPPDEQLAKLAIAYLERQRMHWPAWSPLDCSRRRSPSLSDRWLTSSRNDTARVKSMLRQCNRSRRRGFRLVAATRGIRVKTAVRTRSRIRLSMSWIRRMTRGDSYPGSTSSPIIRSKDSILPGKVTRRTKLCWPTSKIWFFRENRARG
jgi:hypothetical protein